MDDCRHLLSSFRPCTAHQAANVSAKGDASINKPMAKFTPDRSRMLALTRRIRAPKKQAVEQCQRPFYRRPAQQRLGDARHQHQRHSEGAIGG